MEISKLRVSNFICDVCAIESVDRALVRSYIFDIGQAENEKFKILNYRISTLYIRCSMYDKLTENLLTFHASIFRTRATVLMQC